MQLKKIICFSLSLLAADVGLSRALDIPLSGGNDSKGGANIAPKDYASLREKFQADKLVVINVNEIGFSRTYSSYVPTSGPQAKISGASFMVNLSDNSYEWFAPLSVLKGSEKWDEPPKFPGLTNAYYQAIEQAKDDITKPLIQ